MPRPSFHFRISATLLLALLLPALLVLTAGAVDVKVKRDLHEPTCRQSWEAGTPPAETRFPVVIHLLAPATKDRDKVWSFGDAGRLVLAQHLTLTHIAGEIPLDESASLRIDKYNRPYLVPSEYGMSFEYHYYRCAPIKSWNAFLLLLDDIVRNQEGVDHFAVTFGEGPVPRYAPQWQISVKGREPAGKWLYSYEVLNPLPGMHMMTVRDFDPAFYDRLYSVEGQKESE